MTSDKKLLQEIDKLSFEEALQKLEELVAEMESNHSPLEKMIQSFEEGSILASACQAKLDILRQKIEILRKNRQNGSYQWTPLQNSSSPDRADMPDEREDNAENSKGNDTEDVPF